MRGPGLGRSDDVAAFCLTSEVVLADAGTLVAAVGVEYDVLLIAVTASGLFGIRGTVIAGAADGCWRTGTTGEVL
jgi:hypothetical protein